MILTVHNISYLQPLFYHTDPLNNVQFMDFYTNFTIEDTIVMKYVHDEGVIIISGMGCG